MVELDTDPEFGQIVFKNYMDKSFTLLMTEERAQVLDILTHLLLNTAYPIIFCGSEGVGKTRLLEALQHQQAENCRFYVINGHNNLTFDSILEQLDEGRDLVHLGKKERAINHSALSQSSSGYKTVLIVDDAGELAPGICESLWHYVDDNSAISIIFVLNHDQLQLKYRTDPAIEECRLVELQPLTEKQCGDFLKHLSAQNREGLLLNVQADHVEKEVYQSTHGIPSRILSQYVITQVKRQDNSGKWMISAVMVLITVALAAQWLSSDQLSTNENPTVVQAPSKSVDYDIKQPIVSLTLNDGNVDNNDTVSKKSDVITSHETDSSAPNLEKPITRETVSKPEEQTQGDNELADDAIIEKAETANFEDDEDQSKSNLSPENEASDWLSAQPYDFYTLQLMVLSKKQSIVEVINKYPLLQADFRYVHRILGGKEKYILLLGSYNDAQTAIQKKQQLPKEFQGALTRKFSAVRNEFK